MENDNFWMTYTLISSYKHNKEKHSEDRYFRDHYERGHPQ